MNLWRAGVDPNQSSSPTMVKLKWFIHLEYISTYLSKTEFTFILTVVRGTILRGRISHFSGICNGYDSYTAGYFDILDTWVSHYTAVGDQLIIPRWGMNWPLKLPFYASGSLHFMIRIDMNLFFQFPRKFIRRWRTSIFETCHFLCKTTRFMIRNKADGLFYFRFGFNVHVM